ncbi:hypothetical protein N5F13_25510, partial [Comamonas thiooxydans]|uniref:hypothetical protein n=3 Tax=Comamonas thiooxydans TaxID=363952 RepID=UPI00244A6A8F
GLQRKSPLFGGRMVIRKNQSQANKQLVTFSALLCSPEYGPGMALDDRTRRLLEEWEVKHGLSVIQKRLDMGLFEFDREKQKNCYLWLKARQVTLWTSIAGLLALGSAAVAALVVAFTPALK